jgi:DNA-binding NarL/FixJ family response regulator
MNAPFAHKVLIVDDESHIRAYLRLVVTSLGAVEIREAADGANALLMYQQFAPDLVLLDINLVGEDGVAVLGKLLALDAHARVVMLTAVASREMVEKCVAAGALNFIRKDLSRSELIKILHETWAGLDLAQPV